MRINEPCNLDVPSGATPMTIADAILRECDGETLTDVLHYIDCFMKNNHLKMQNNRLERHGKWIEVEDSQIRCRCSVCGWESHLYEDDVYGMPYCPNCGARMDEND